MGMFSFLFPDPPDLRYCVSATGRCLGSFQVVQARRRAARTRSVVPCLLEYVSTLKRYVCPPCSVPAFCKSRHLSFSASTLEQPERSLSLMHKFCRLPKGMVRISSANLVFRSSFWNCESWECVLEVKYTYPDHCQKSNDTV